MLLDAIHPHLRVALQQLLTSVKLTSSKARATKMVSPFANVIFSTLVHAKSIEHGLLVPMDLVPKKNKKLS